MAIAYLGLGSNMGNRLAILKAALEQLATSDKVTLVSQSSFYETLPWGNTKQDNFINCCCQIETQLTPQELLMLCQAIEQSFGRQRLEHWGPRTLDIDILLFDQLIINQADLIIPHPYLDKRAFVLLPLAQIAKDQLHPLRQQNIASLADALPEKSRQEVRSLIVK